MSKELVYNNTVINFEAERISLTDMWRAVGGDQNKKPSQWLRTDLAQEFIAFVEENSKGAYTHLSIVETKAGVGGGTWAHWQVAMAAELNTGLAGIYETQRGKCGGMT